MARCALLCAGLTAIAICLTLVYLERLDTPSASYAKGGLTAASTVVQMAIHSSLISVVSARGIFSGTRVSRVLAMVGQSSWMDALGAGDMALMTTMGLDALLALGLAYTAGSSVGTFNRPFTTGYVGSCDPQTFDRDGFAYNKSLVPEPSGRGSRFLGVLGQAGLVDDPDANIGSIVASDDNRIREVQTYHASATCQPIIDVDAFARTYYYRTADGNLSPSELADHRTGTYQGSPYGSIGQRRPPNYDNQYALFVEYDPNPPADDPDTNLDYVDPILNGTAKIIVQYFNVRGDDDFDLAPTVLMRESGNTTATFGTAQMTNASYAYIVQFACSVPLSLG